MSADDVEPVPALNGCAIGCLATLLVWLVLAALVAVVVEIR